ncbi:MAG: ribonuclease HI family protein [Elusimicrobiota bacterium]|jgi:ribonuclease HI|nr:ribonuclease HI family protein [Elusimicrobiota bacterium]
MSMDLIINIDGGSRGNPGPGAAAWVIKDKAGKPLLKEGLFMPLCTNNQAEFTALKMALAAAVRLGAKRLEIYSDSQLLVRQYGGQYKIKNPDLRLIMDDIKKLAAAFAAVNLKHVPRGQNKEADLMCNITMDNTLKKKPAAATSVAPAPPKKPSQPELFALPE